MADLISPSMVMAFVALIVGAALLRRRVLVNEEWRATVTPLASIIGSGFLVAGPILAYAAGSFTLYAMLGLCALAYLFGEAIRYNIRTVEPLHKTKALPGEIALIERASDIALAFAYFVSVAYYINLFAAYGLRLIDVIDPSSTTISATAVLAVLGTLGAWKGLRALENLEAVAVAIKLALIAGLLATLALTSPPDAAPLATTIDVPVLLGLVILVQGFETSRYLGAEHSAEMRVRTMRKAQLLATLIYVAFIFLMTPYFTGTLPAEGGETEIISLLMPLGILVAPMVIVAALASQMSAAVADMGGAGGLIEELSAKKLPIGAAYLATAIAAILITWGAGIMEIITYASKAFVIYYSLQSLVALLMAAKEKQPLKAALFAIALLCGLVVILLGSPVAA